MPYLIPSRTPLTPEQVEWGFDYLLTLQMGGGAAVAGRADAELAFVLLRLAEDIVWPVTAVDGPATRARTPSPWTKSGACCCPHCGTGRGSPPPRQRRVSHAASSGSQ
ncbi:hypothetical protein [Streptomyces sp. NPDC056291]|uniref:hypothetical protein n=1 Tax=Streptomyces sp. NPDC056291 TaxID=3345772 RepID=UPI0035E1E5B0